MSFQVGSKANTDTNLTTAMSQRNWILKLSPPNLSYKSFDMKND